MPMILQLVTEDYHKPEYTYSIHPGSLDIISQSRNAFYWKQTVFIEMILNSDIPDLEQRGTIPDRGIRVFNKALELPHLSLVMLNLTLLGLYWSSAFITINVLVESRVWPCKKTRLWSLQRGKKPQAHLNKYINWINLSNVNS